MEITPDLLDGVDTSVGYRVIAYATLACPCLHNLNDTRRDTAIEILKEAAAQLVEMPASFVRSESDGPFRTEYTPAEVRSAFSADDLAVLRSFCRAAPRGPIGSFPAPSKSLLAVWPE